MNPSISFSTVAIALISGCLGLMVIGVVGALIGRALFPRGGTPYSFTSSLRTLAGWNERRQFKRRQANYVEASKYLDAGLLHRALPLLRHSFFLDTLRLDGRLIELVSSHHLQVLERLVEVSHAHGRSLFNLPVVEDLLIARAQLFRSYFDARNARSSLSQRIQEKGRPAPAWATGEHDKRIDEIRDRIATNARSLESQLKELFAHLESSPAKQDEVTYH